MLIEAYFQQLSGTIASRPFLELSQVSFDKRGRHEGFLRGELTFTDGSILHIREYVDVEVMVDRLMYVYQYMDSEGHLIFRYDNTGHHRELNLPSFPHHKHEGSEDNVVASSAPTLLEVLIEVQEHIPLL